MYKWHIRWNMPLFLRFFMCKVLIFWIKWGRMGMKMVVSGGLWSEMEQNLTKERRKKGGELHVHG